MRTQTATRPATARPRHAPAASRLLSGGLLVLGIGAATVAVLGPLLTGTIRYHVSEGAANQIVGGDVAGLLLVAPVSVLAGLLVWRGHVAGPRLALGPAAYGLYMYGQLALGNDIQRYPGNAERFFPLFLGLFVLAGVIAIASWRTVRRSASPPGTDQLTRRFGWFVLVIAAFLTLGLHLPGLADAWADAPSSTEYLADPVVFWLVKFMDLGLVVPSLIAVGVGLLRRAAWAMRAQYAAAGWVALLGSSVAGMAVVMQATGDPAATTANTIAFAAFATIGLGMAALVFRPLFVPDDTPRQDAAPDD